jgi:hypothetical protein
MDQWSSNRGGDSSVWSCPWCLESSAASDANVSWFFIAWIWDFGVNVFFYMSYIMCKTVTNENTANLLSAEDQLTREEEQVWGNIFRYVEHEREVRNSFKIFIGNLNGSDHLEEVGIEWTMILQDLKEEQGMRMCVSLNWLHLGCSG